MLDLDRIVEIRPGVAETIGIQLAHAKLDKIYDEVMTRFILKQESIEKDKKEISRAARLLRSRDARLTLGVIWKESSLVYDEELAILKLNRQFDGPINCNQLTELVIENKKFKGKTYIRIRDICLTAHSYKLLQRHRMSQTLIIISATEHLHNLFMQVGTLSRSVIDDFLQARCL